MHFHAHHFQRTVARILLMAFTAGLCVSSAVHAVNLHPLFSDGVVLQFGKKVNIFGTASNGEQITVSINGQTRTGTASNGKFLVQLNPMDPGGPYTLTVKGSNTVTVKDVRIGDVWICSGQSNAYTSAGSIAECKKAYSSFSSKDVRLFNMAPTPAEKPSSELRTYSISGMREKENRMSLYNKWYATSWNITQQCAAMGVAHVIKIHQKTNMPVAMIQGVVGNTKIEHWIPYDGLKNSRFSGVLGEIAKNPIPNKKKFPSDGGIHKLFQVPTYCFNGTIAPLTPFTVSGVIWLQGESNVGNGRDYGDLMKLMITQWRKWFQDEIAFIPVQLAGWTAKTGAAEGGGVALVREGQARALELNNTGLATAYDFSEEKIHHHNQGNIGWRCAAVALRLVHGKNSVGAGPWLKSFKKEGGNIVLQFSHTGGGLVAGGNSGKLTGFAVAGSNGKYVNAQATIRGTEVVLSASGVSSPAHARYAFSTRPVANLFNKEGFPAFPFRTEKMLKGDPAPLGPVYGGKVDPPDTSGTTPQPTEDDFTAAVVKINFGGGFADGWIDGDQYAQGGAAFTFSGAAITDGVSGAAPASVYSSVRHNPGNAEESIGFVFPDVPDGNYTLRFHVTDQYGGRAIDILAQGTALVEDLDPVTAGGGEMTAVIKEANVTIAGGKGLTVTLRDDRPEAERKDVFLSGLEIIRAGTALSPGRYQYNRPGANYGNAIRGGKEHPHDVAGRAIPGSRHTSGGIVISRTKRISGVKR